MMSSTKPLPVPAKMRLTRELSLFSKSPPPGISCYTPNDTLTHLHAQIAGKIMALLFVVCVWGRRVETLRGNMERICILSFSTILFTNPKRKQSIVFVFHSAYLAVGGNFFVTYLNDHVSNLWIYASNCVTNNPYIEITHLNLAQHRSSRFTI